MVTLVNEHSKSEISTGGDSGMGFAFCRQVGPDKFETAMPIKCCKDIMSDVLARERYADINKISKYFSYVVDKKNPLFAKDYSYMVVNYQTGHCENVENRNLERTSKFVEKAEVIERLLNNLDKHFGFLSTEIYLHPEFLIFKFDSKWTLTTQLISLYTLIIRVSEKWDSNQHYIEFLNNIQYKYGDGNYSDGNYAKSAVAALQYRTIEEFLTDYLRHGFCDSHTKGIHWFGSSTKIKE